VFINILQSLGLQTTGTSVDSQSAQFQQNLQQLDQYSTSNPQAAIQLLQSLPPAEQQALMQALGQQDPQGAAKLYAALQQQEQQLLGQAPSQINRTNIAAMVELAQNLGKMIGGPHNQQQQSQQEAQTGPNDGYSPLTTMTA
jgi:hypothetical protein